MNHDIEVRFWIFFQHARFRVPSVNSPLRVLLSDQNLASQAERELPRGKRSTDKVDLVFAPIG